MRLDAFLIADAVSTPPDGKFYIHGGGLSRFEVPDIPFPMSLGVFARLEVSDDEAIASHNLLFALIGPTGRPNIPPLEIESGSEKSLEPLLNGEQRFMQIAFSMTALVIRIGLYRMEISVDGEQFGSIPLPVVLANARGQVTQLTQGTSTPATRPKAKRPPPPPKKTKRRK